jgi:hypothetical protein
MGLMTIFHSFTIIGWSSLYKLDTNSVEGTTSNVSSSLARSLVAADTCLPRRCPAIAASIRSIIPAFSRHVTVRKIKIIFKYGVL